METLIKLPSLKLDNHAETEDGDSFQIVVLSDRLVCAQECTLPADLTLSITALIYRITNSESMRSLLI